MTETWAACYTLCRRLILLYRGVEVSQCDYVVISVGANHMVKNLTKHGNCLALIIDYGVLDLLDIDAAPPLSVTTDGKSPVRGAHKVKAFRAALRQGNRRYSKILKRLA